MYNHYHNTTQYRSNLVLGDPKRVPDTSVPIITIDSVKEWLKVDYDDEDNTINSLISSGIEWVELITGTCLWPTTVTAILHVRNEIELPYGPVISITSVNGASDFDERLIEPATGDCWLIGSGKYTVVYEAGYTVLPETLSTAVKQYVAYCFEHRGDSLNESSPTFAPEARMSAAPYIKNYGI